jgi:hypothetical protein
LDPELLPSWLFFFSGKSLVVCSKFWSRVLAVFDSNPIAWEGIAKKWTGVFLFIGNLCGREENRLPEIRDIQESLTLQRNFVQK